MMKTSITSADDLPDVFAEPRLSWGLIGCGDIARKRVAPALRDLETCDLVAVSRARSELADAFAKEFGARKAYLTWHDLINDREVQAVYIATPVHQHAEQAIAVAHAGKHVLCEKPMAMNVTECKRMVRAAREANVKLGVAYYRRFYPVIERIKKIIDSGELGTPVLAQMNAFEWFDPPTDHPRRWLLNKNQSGGGPMFDFGCHRIEVLLNLFGPINEVRAITTNALFDREVEDTATALFKFETGACATLAVTHAARTPQDTLDVFGSQGSIHVPALNEGTIRVCGAAGGRIETYPSAANLHAPLIEDFVTAVLSDREPSVSGEVGMAVAIIDELIYA